MLKLIGTLLLLPGIFFAPALPGRSSSTDTEQEIRIGRRVFEEVYSQEKLSVVDELYAPDFVDDSPGGGKGPELIKEAVAMFHRAAPDFHVDIEDAFAAGDKVTLRYTGRGTQTGELMGIPPTGKRLDVRGITIFQIVDGKIKTEWTEYDRLGLMRQLGVVKP
ncbi:MAG TPA: ester cyclase [Blastocatellia bacterium]|nr:ester cyclase [Blastocatellia bacterium]